MELYSKSSPSGHRYQQVSSTNYVGVDAWTGDPPPDLYSTLSWVNSLAGYKNPHWRSQVIAQLNATTPMTAFKWSMESSPGHYRVQGNLGPGKPDNRKCSTIFLGSPVSTAQLTGINTIGIPAGTAENDAAGEWYNKVRNAMSTFKGSVFAGESAQARRMMIDRASKMLTKIPYFQHKLRKSWVKSKTKRGKLKTLSNSYLELVFGWGPLASDIEDAYKVLHNPTPMFQRVKAFGVHTATQQNSVVPGGAGNCIHYTNERRATMYQVIYRGLIRAREDPAGSRLLDFGLGFREFLPTMWEVIPWSFAVDYFTNISDIVNAISYASVEVRWLAKTVRQSRSRTFHTTFHPNGTSTIGWIERQNVPSHIVHTAHRVDRSLLPGNYVPVPGLTFQLPSARQVLNLTALAVSRRLRLAY